MLDLPEMTRFSIIVFLLSLIYIFYILIGYPLLLGFLASLTHKPILKQPGEKTVSVLIPVRNGEPFVRAKLESILKLNYPQNLLEILVISDGSDDRTDELVKEFIPQGVKLLRLPRSGKPAALNAGMPQVHGEIVLLTDVRQVLHPQSLSHLVACFADSSVGVVSGDLVIMAGEHGEEKDMGLYWRYETWIRNQLSRIDSMIGAMGSFYAIRRELLRPIPADIILDDVYLPMTAFFQGYRLIVEPAAKVFDFPTSLQSEFRRKVRTLAGNYQLVVRLPILLGFSNRMWIHYVSLKLGRLLLPYALLALAISSFGLPGYWRTLALIGQIFFYGIGALDFYIPKAWTIKRVSSMVQTFVVMMAAAACAISVFFVNPTSLWKETKVRQAKPPVS